MTQKTTQHQKIIEMQKDGLWHCVNEYRAMFVFNGWKRRIEIEGRKNRNELPTGKYIFEERKCEHGINNQKDYRMFINERLYKKVQYTIPDLGKQITLFEKVGIS